MIGMGRKPIDLSNQTFGELSPIKAVGKTKHGSIIWKCKCNACGKFARVSAGDLRSGHTTSCGCTKASRIANARTTHGDSPRTKPRAPEYYIWHQLRQRCTNPQNSSYKYYGQRGIEVHPRWLKYENFLADMGRRPSPLHSIERRNNNGGYSPTNCKWGTKSEQVANKRNNRKLTLGDDTFTLSEWARISGLKRTTLSRRLDAGWDVHLALTEPLATAIPAKCRA
jgi:hypothetical protein